MPIQFKDSTNLSGVRPEMALGIMVAEGVYSRHNVDLIVTSVTDGKHGPHSRHRVGLGADFRTFHIKTEHLQSVVSDLKKSLGPHFDVVHEADHIHIEYDPDE
jgi:hypothetical protein